MIALHVFPDLDYGHFGFKEGLYMASCDELHVEVKGVGAWSASRSNSESIIHGIGIYT